MMSAFSEDYIITRVITATIQHIKFQTIKTQLVKVAISLYVAGSVGKVLLSCKNNYNVSPFYH